MKRPLQAKKVSLEAAERQLDRTQEFFLRIDSKVSALFAITSAQVAIVALNITYVDLKAIWLAFTTAFFVLAIGWTIFNLYRCTYPNLGGGKSSLVYFSEISKLEEDDFSEKYSTLTEEELMVDILSQVWRNSTIVAAKYGYLKQATISAIISIIPWGVILLATSITHSKIPMLQ